MAQIFVAFSEKLNFNLIFDLAGNNWGKCEDGTSGMGCGPQETFRSCADIKIVFHPLLMSMATKGGWNGNSLPEEQQEDTFYDISVLENELAPSPSSPSSDNSGLGGGISEGSHSIQFDEINSNFKTSPYTGMQYPGQTTARTPNQTKKHKQTNNFLFDEIKSDFKRSPHVGIMQYGQSAPKTQDQTNKHKHSNNSFEIYWCDNKIFFTKC